MLPDWVSNPGPLTYESGALPIALRGPAPDRREYLVIIRIFLSVIHINICCDPSSELSQKDSSDEGSKHMVSKNEK